MQRLLIGLTILLSIHRHTVGEHKTTKKVWDHLQRLFMQLNFIKKYQLENDICALHHKNMSIQEFYSTMTNLWDQSALTKLTELKVCGAYIARIEHQ